nr:hypothetical protein Iba_chr04eCG6210 [Ipomoea batatas]
MPQDGLTRNLGLMQSLVDIACKVVHMKYGLSNFALRADLLSETLLCRLKRLLTQAIQRGSGCYAKYYRGGLKVCLSATVLEQSFVLLVTRSRCEVQSLETGDVRGSITAHALGLSKFSTENLSKLLTTVSLSADCTFDVLRKL